ncbi:fibropellin-1-like [Acropora millepora]|uniref:fibropellin-1-like n=1 Tax=Acropora millepora TaxID=45264 RepID=UPI001CF57EB4|nr:fibropellin-1-like [Acropora millepora]
MAVLLVWVLVGACFYIGATGNPCSPNLCWNGGLCSTNGSSFTCSCPQGFRGQKCEYRSTDCQVNPCVHGICSLDKSGKPECYCTPGFTGQRCEIDHNECASEPCKNGALCIDQVNGYKCICNGDTYGRHCEIHQSEVQQCIERCDQEICWRNYSTTVGVTWGYNPGICSTSHSCFGGENDTESNIYDTFVEVQLKPLQIQAGDTLNFTADAEIVAYANGFVPHHVVATDGAKSFVACNESNGIPIVNKPTNSVVVGLDILTPGVHYFIANIDSTFRCHFGLRLNVSVKENKCVAPASNLTCSDRGQCTTNFTTPDFSCKCCGGFRGDYCEKVDYCFSKPCKNDAECQNLEASVDGNTHVCICQPGYEGRDCSHVTDMCLSAPCAHGGQCVPRVNNFTCDCPKGFIGRYCEIDVNECDSNPCLNGACVDRPGEFLCNCLAGFTGPRCEVDIDECSSSPCLHGTCIDQVNGFKCHCLAGYSGVLCDFNIQECLPSNPCHNGGRCIDKVNGYRCDCGLGFKGSHCEIDVDLCNDPSMCSNSVSCTETSDRQSVQCTCKAGFTGHNCAVNINDCLSSPCKNGGTCRDKISGFQCICGDGFTGITCDDFAEKSPGEEFQRQLSVKMLTEDCRLLQMQGQAAVTHIQQAMAASIAEACNCSFTSSDIAEGSVLLQCRNSMSAEVSMQIKPANHQRLICQFHSLLTQRQNVIDLGHSTFAVRVLSDVSYCDHLDDEESPVDARNQERHKVSSSRHLAITISLVCAAVGLIVAAILVCLKFRRTLPPVKKHPSKGENQLIEDLSADLLSAVAPTPKSMYRTSGGYHNMAFSGRFNPENPVKSRRV